jgi:DNA-binding NarL/FixJ family response regulator
MQKIKVMLASRPKIISDVIRNLIDRQPDMTLLGEVVDPIQLIVATSEKEVDVVIVTPLKANGEPIICRHLLEEHPNLKIVVLLDKGEAAYLYQSGADKKLIEDPSADSILGVIRDAVNLITE